MATNYPGALDTTSNLPTSPDPFVEDVTAGHLQHSPTVHGGILALEAKVGIGTSPAASAATGNVLAKNANGTTTWQAQTGGAAIVTIQDEGSTTSSTVNTINFAGAGVVATGAGSTATVTVTGGNLGSAGIYVPPDPIGSGSSDVTAFETWLATTPAGAAIVFPPGA